MAEKYVPPPKETEKAEEMMTEEQGKMSKLREEAFAAGESKVENEKSFSMEGEKVVEFMRNEMDRIMKNLEYLNSDEHVDYRRARQQGAIWERDQLMRDLGYANGVGNEISHSMVKMLEDASGEKFPELKNELSAKLIKIQRLKDEIHKNANQIVEKILARSSGGSR